MDRGPLLRYVIFGKIRHDYILPPHGKPCLDILGGNLIYAAAGSALWENGIGLVARVGEDFPQEWLTELEKHGFDLRGIRVLPQAVDLRWFVAYRDPDEPEYDNPVSHFSRLGQPFPKGLLGYTPPGPQLDHRASPTDITIRLGDFPGGYLDATAAHICPLDYISQALLPPMLRHGHISTITLDPSPGYMDPSYWNEIPGLVNGITALLTSEEKMTKLFQGRSTDLWEMAEAIASFGCDIVVIKRGTKGQYLYDHSARARWMIPAYPARMIDPTGAGDAFCGGFLVGYRNTYSPVQATLFGNISASLVIEGIGPLYSLDTMPGLAQARLEALQKMVRKA